MKKLFTLIASAFLMLPAVAQEVSVDTTTVSVPSQQEQLLVYENPTISVYVGDITYVPMTRGQKTTNLLTGLLASGEISIEDEAMVEGAKEALAGCLRDVKRFDMKVGEVSPEDMESGRCLVFSAKIIFCNFTEKLNRTIMDKEARIVAYITLTDPKTKRVYFNEQVSGWSWLSIFNTMAECREYTQNNLWVDAASKMRRAYPLRGHMLEKGFEKGKKQKLQDFYIDLGSDQRLFTGANVTVYTVKRIAGRIARQQIGTGRVVEVEGNDISLCKVLRHGDRIKEAFDRGAEIAVQVY